WVGAVRADDDVIEAIAVDVAGRSDATARIIPRIDPVELEAVRPVQGRKFKDCRKPTGLAEHDVARAGVLIPSWICAVGADYDIIECVAVHIPHGGDTETAEIKCIDAVQDEAVLAGFARKLDGSRSGTQRDGSVGKSQDLGVADRIGSVVAV